ncbi:helix-turn-helix domain-containing protein [Ornithinibacillus halophilus]|uniref:Helix-turn-helix domain-containing protein n=1 Tax=Ornithinibacillus halophilus TaxID=930117 RepID=A0A1M5GJA1_9BACI|nr:helix-turn-helix transcriptional regulator [Ornithinibacillus halophilus]SHG03824.1 Helix-turn-helix domain-containing protein [Ornithinibacillus halophilus]
MDAFRLRVENLLDKHGLTKKDVSERLGYSDNWFAQLLRNDELPSTEVSRKIAKLLDVSLDYLIEGKECFLDKDRKLSVEQYLQLEHLFEKHGMENPFIFQAERWPLLERDGLMFIQTFFEWQTDKNSKKQK